MINTKLQSIIDTKAAIGNAITNKGGTITTNTPFFNYAAQIDGISTGTPQTIFEASDGSKWALTNAVNLTNVSNNVTSDFNYWQPANNSTSDPILNIGTVGDNISGNIQLVPVNQVNIAQYENIVATDTDGGKYVGYNGYDSQTNPTPTGNTTFNRWLLNNSATGTVIFANATFTTGTFNGPNTSINEASIPFVNNTINYGNTIFTTFVNNGFVYAGGGVLTGTNRGVSKFYESNLVLVNNTVNFGGSIRALTTNNGFIYVGGQTNQTVQKYYESNLAFVGNTPSYGGNILGLTTNNGCIFASGVGNRHFSVYFESNLGLKGNTSFFGSNIKSIKVNNAFIYIGTNQYGQIQKFHEGNFVFVAETELNFAQQSPIESVAINNGFVYAGFNGFNTVDRFYESNLAFQSKTNSYNGIIKSIAIDNGFLYATGYNNADIKKYYESNLTFLGNSVSYGANVETISVKNGFIYVGGETNNTVQQFQEKQTTFDNQTFYTATKIKE
jgi:hypothetical protein